MNTDRMAVTMMAQARVSNITRCAPSPRPTWASTAVVAMDAGTLPKAMRRTICQSTVPCLPWNTTPTPLVRDANNRSVPMATAAGTLSPMIRMGVIKAPPPTPVAPTTMPTNKPARENSIMGAQRARWCPGRAI